MAKERRKIIRAGSLWMAVQYSTIRGENQSARREARSQISTPARESLNARMSWQKLMMVLATNFRSKDLVVTLTYRDEDLPPTREIADKRLSCFIRNLRTSRRFIQQILMYVRVTEGYHSDGRLHHHLIINATGDDYEIIRQLWKKNGDNAKIELFGRDGAERWGKYLTKEPREKGRRYVGDRTWRASRNLKRPEPFYEFVPAEAALIPPSGAEIVERTECQNSYGRFTYVVAMLPENEN